ncbi:hypothetical protein C8J55DRAFT_530919 [Lentinula edodes]|uniref:Secreted protein n=1 Tax=Lentinula lateritia TaxID=40482 RepID=A0A9W8ZRK6_9AGAR|nr:hypothetical protein C8J55DRAFT_530919 [Lentinula edodes]
MVLIPVFFSFSILPESTARFPPPSSLKSSATHPLQTPRCTSFCSRNSTVNCLRLKSPDTKPRNSTSSSVTC